MALDDQFPELSVLMFVAMLMTAIAYLADSYLRRTLLGKATREIAIG